MSEMPTPEPTGSPEPEDDARVHQLREQIFEQIGKDPTAATQAMLDVMIQLLSQMGEQFVESVRFIKLIASPGQRRALDEALSEVLQEEPLPTRATLYERMLTAMKAVRRQDVE